MSLREAWGQWIARQPWSLFMTLTSEKQTHPEALYKRARYVFGTWETHVYGRQRKPAGHTLQWLYAMERHKSGNPHGHALVHFPQIDLRGPEGKNIFDLCYWKDWTDATGGFCRLELPRSQQHVVNYVSKYVVKGGELEWSRSCDFPKEAWTQILLAAMADPVAAGGGDGPPRPGLLNGR